MKPPCSFTSEETTYLTSRIQNGGTEVVEVTFFYIEYVSQIWNLVTIWWPFINDLKNNITYYSCTNKKYSDM